jgi:hypothetical protein
MSYRRNDNNKGYLYRDNQNNVMVSSQPMTKSRGPGMVSDKMAADACGLPLFRETDFKPAEGDVSIMKKYHASFVVKKGKDGGLYAADMGQGIFTDGMTRDELINNIHEAVECHFDVPSYEDVDIRIKYD